MEAHISYIFKLPDCSLKHVLSSCLDTQTFPVPWRPGLSLGGLTPQSSWAGYGLQGEAATVSASTSFLPSSGL